MLYSSPLIALAHRLAWDKKLKIAILSFATFAAMC